MEQVFEMKAETDGIRFRYARGRSAQSGAEIHPYHEILYFIGGDAEFVSENERLRVPQNTLFIIPSGMFHRFDIRNQSTYERYVFNFASVPMELAAVAAPLLDEIKVMAMRSEEIPRVFRRLGGMFGDGFSDAERRILMKALFYQLIMELGLDSESVIPLKVRSAESLVARAISYIDAHYRGRLGVGDVARALNVSESLLSHYFKRELNVSVYHYITEKRLALAHRLIDDGMPLTEVCQQCGYGDYSGFYRAYVKMFGKRKDKKT
ncbi:MAG: helix-turn-helix transcriptional regulator [Clostridia bacterium]|nr:helix-turn-helix transcriptional regulator [Clostridia bacterium]